MGKLEKGTWLKAKDGSNFARFNYYEADGEVKRGPRKKSETPTGYFNACAEARSLPLVCERVQNLRLDEYEEASDAEKTLLEALYETRRAVHEAHWKTEAEKLRVRMILERIDVESVNGVYQYLDNAFRAVNEVTKRIDGAVELTGQKYISAGRYYNTRYQRRSESNRRRALKRKLPTTLVASLREKRRR